MSVKKAAVAIMSKGELSEKQHIIDENEQLLEKGMHFLIAKSQEIAKLKVEIEALSTADDALEALLAEVLEDLGRHPYVEEAFFENEWLCVKTTKLIAYTQAGEGAPIPPGLVKLNLLNAAIRGEARNAKESLGGTPLKLAPHFLSGGRPCLGEAACAIADLISEQQYYPAMLMVLEFLQAINEGDSAGGTYKQFQVHGDKWWKNWRDSVQGASK